MVKSQTICCVILFAVLLFGCQSVNTVDKSTLVFIENQYISVGINLNWGGAITHVSTPGGPNLINSYDLGRQIQQSYYSGPANYQRQGKQKSPHWATFPWNPIQTGDAFHNGSRVIEHQARDGQLYVKTVPMLWPMNNDPAECLMETWITLSSDGPTFSYRARLTNARSDKKQYHAHQHEVPAVYVNGPWHRLITYKGDKPFANESVTELRNDHKERWPWINVLATEGWAALVNDAGTGIGVCVPMAMEFHGGFAGRRGRGGEKSVNTGYMSPITREILDHNIVYEYRCTFALGTIQDIRREAYRLTSKAPHEWSFDDRRHGWYYQGGHDDGWPLTAGLAVKAYDTTKPVRLMSPLTFWRAETAPTLAVQVSSKTPGTMTVFWRGMPPDEASAKPSKWNDWFQHSWDRKKSTSAVIPVGDRKWVRINLAAVPSYTGGITGLAIDVPHGVTVHKVRLMAQ
jgi:hypothetical protein